MLEFDIEDLLRELALQRNAPVISLEVGLHLHFGPSGKPVNGAPHNVAAEDLAVLTIGESNRAIVEVALQGVVARTVSGIDSISDSTGSSRVEGILDIRKAQLIPINILSIEAVRRVTEAATGAP